MLPIQNTLKRLLLTGLCIPLLCAWTIGAKPTDETSTIETVSSCTQSVPSTLSVYEKVVGNLPEECHRWGLKWSLYKTSADITPDEIQDVSVFTAREDDWVRLLSLADPSDDGATRLPTIKELVRIFEYNNTLKSTAGVPTTDDIFRAWLQAEDDEAAVLNGYLISSTYRHINSMQTVGGATVAGEMDADVNVNDNSDKKRVRVLGVEIGTGKVVAFDGYHKLCVSLNVAAECSSPATDVKVYALLVGPL